MTPQAKPGGPMRAADAGYPDPVRSMRRRPPFVVWLVLGGAVLAALACVALGVMLWEKVGVVQTLRTELDVLKNEREGTEQRLSALQATATALSDRVLTLEANDPAQQLAELQKAVETASDSEQLEELSASVDEIQARVGAFQATLDDVSARIDALMPRGSGEDTDPLPAQVRLVVGRQRQSHNLSCESSAASMAAQYLGVDLSEAEVLAALPRNPNPYLGFRGNVDGPTGGTDDYGVYSGPILAILNSEGLRARPVSEGLTGIRAAIARGNPVIAWITYNCLLSTPVTEIIDGQQVSLVPDQHTVVVTGYDAEGFWANDPWDGKEDYYASAELERAMGYFGGMAIEVAAP